jgi:beta-aspartyl-peptidase (threonine type)
VIIVASANGAVGMDAAWDILGNGGSALDAVEAAARAVEDNPDDHTVGYGGYPNLLGDVELDASIMDGTTRRCGAVGALRGYRAAITVARAVMDRLPHVLIVGDGAARLAAELDLPEEDLLTDAAEKVWRAGLEGRLPDDSTGARMLSVVATLATDPERAAGTVNFLAIDADDHIASAVSTSGWAWKYPGRLGDTPVIGAGNYCDDRYGAAVCTGFGELAIRSGTARMVVHGIASGLTVEAAARAAIEDLYSLDVPTQHVIMNLVAIDAHGNHTAASTQPDATYVYRGSGMSTHASVPRVHVGAP